MRSTWSLSQTDALSFLFLVNAGDRSYLVKSTYEEHLCVVATTDK